jgi:hypothetical protein
MLWMVFLSIIRSLRLHTHSIRYMPYRLDDYLLVGTRWNLFHLVPISSRIMYLVGFTIDMDHKIVEKSTNGKIKGTYLLRMTSQHIAWSSVSVWEWPVLNAIPFLIFSSIHTTALPEYCNHRWSVEVPCSVTKLLAKWTLQTFNTSNPVHT